ncbi:hypothetical protein ABTX71_34300 [Streptomyces parvulus]|uniref:hypothetical protein n=1 Tax=Streptomyces parvulus TaxID=146923 RepID=UPI003317BEE2
MTASPNGLDDVHEEARRELKRWVGLYQQLGVGETSWVYRSFADLLADHGHYQAPAPWVHGGKQRPGRCFETASRWAEQEGWLYVEGLAYAPSAAPFSCFEHAWCLTADGLVADPSLPDGVATGYLGVPLTRAFRRQQQAARGTSAVLVSDPVNPFAGNNDRVLRTGLPEHALAHPRSGPMSGCKGRGR